MRRRRSHVREWASLLEEHVSDDALDQEEPAFERETGPFDPDR